MLEATFAFKMPPTSAAFNNSLKGLLPVGIYNGGRVIPGPGLSVRVEPWVGRSQDLTVRNEEWEIILVGSTGVHYLCLEAKHLPNGPTVPQWLLLTPTQHQNRPDQHELITFAMLNIPANAVVTTADMIDHSPQKRISLQMEDFWGRVYSGTARLNGSLGVQVDHYLGHKDYVVMVTPGEAPNTGLGDIYVEKQANSFLIYITGLATTKIDWMLVNKRPAPRLGPLGVAITPIQLYGPGGFIYPHRIGLLDHHFAVVPESADPTAAGNIWINRGLDSDGVYNSGAMQRAIAGWWPITGQAMTYGHANFTRGGATVVNTSLGTMDYFVHVMPIEEPLGLNSFWVERFANSFSVYQDGSATTEFQYLLVKDPNQFIHGNGPIPGPLPHYLNSTGYVPLVTPNQNLGRISVLRGYNGFEVFTERSGSGFCDWLVMPQRVWG